MVIEIGLAIAGLIGAYVLYVVLSKAKSARHRRKALNGDYGEETRWATEMVDEGDTLFILAVQSIPEMELKEVGIVAESKEELRELVIERYEEGSA